MFPLKPGSKTPARSGWEQIASSSPDPAWWPMADQGAGIACGPSRLVVVDLDLPHGPRNWFRLVDQHRACQTYTVETPSGGMHLYYSNADGYAIRNSAGLLAPGIDVRAAGGYVVAYDPIWDRDLAPVPEWLAELLTRRPHVTIPRPTSVRPSRRAGQPSSRAYGPKALEQQVQDVHAAAVGTRNHTLNRAAFKMGQLVAGDELDRAQAEQELTQAGLAIGLDELEVTKTVESGLVSGLDHPRVRK